MRMSSLTNEEPLVVVESGVDIVREVIGKNCGDSRNSMVGKGEASLRRGGYRSILKRASGAENRDVGHSWSSDGHRGSGVFVSRGSDEDVVGIDGDVLMERGEEEGVENLLSYSGRSGRHCRWRRNN
jgi:hypothetical protein